MSLSQKASAIIKYICRNRGKPQPATPSQASKLARIAAARSAPTARPTQADQVVAAVLLAREVQTRLAEAFASPAATRPAAARTGPTRRADDLPPVEPKITQPVPTVEKPLAPQFFTYPIRGVASIEMTAKELLAKYNSLHGAEGLAFYREHSKQIDAARAGIRLDAGRFPELSGTDRTVAALQRQFPSRP
jgi:hypothetical protein